MPEAPPELAAHQLLGASGYTLKGDLEGQANCTHTTDMKLMQNKETSELVAAEFIHRRFCDEYYSNKYTNLPASTEGAISNLRKLVHPNIIRFKEVGDDSLPDVAVSR